MSARTRILRFLRHWHARIGVLAALFFLLLAVTGLALNHTSALQLDKKQVTNRWLMQWYGLQMDHQVMVWDTGEVRLISAGERWLLSDGQPQPGIPVGLASLHGVNYVAFSDTLALYLPDGRMVEKLAVQSLPAPAIKRIGVSGESLVLETVRGLFYSGETLEWQQGAPENVHWSAPRSATSGERDLAEQQLGPSLPLERVFLDIHSGRILGAYGPWVMDVAAVILILLSLSGLWIYFRTILKKRHS